MHIVYWRASTQHLTMSWIKYLITVLFFATAWTSSEAAVWVKLNQSKDSKLLIDKQSIIEQQDYKKAWAMVDYGTPQKNPDSVDKVYNSTKALWFFDCKTQKSATTQIFQYLDQELVYSASVDVKNAEFIEPLPDSNVEIAMRYVCKKFAPAPAAVSKPPATVKDEQPKNPEPQAEAKASEKPKANSTTEDKRKEEKTIEDTEPEPAVTDETTEEKPEQKSTNHTKWSYSGKKGPKYWAKLNPEFSACEAGLNQSPINIQSTIHAALKPIRTIHKFPAKDIVNNGHTIQISFQEGNIIVLDKTLFKLKQVHFHAPSENTINGKQFPLEAHFVHADIKGNLAVIAVMFKEGEANPTIGQFLEQVSSKVDQVTKLKGRYTPNTIMPTKQQYYRYNGSLTTPPCSEGVRWIVMKTPMTVSREQIESFERAIHQHNNRPTQPLNGRAVLE